MTHDLADSEYNDRRNQVESAVNTIKQHYPKVDTPRDVSMDMLEQANSHLEATARERLSFVLQENERVLKTCEALSSGNLSEVGKYLNASHAGLSKMYEVSCPELDFLAEFAQSKPYVLGARMMGGGFGGCTINLVKKGHEDELISTCSPAYQTAMNKTLTAITVGLGEGVNIIK